jgi:hypothetical protein
MHRSILLLVFLAAFGVQSATAQQPTSEQRAAIRAACRSDFIANCAGVEPGGKEALDCLTRRHDVLSTPCKTAVDAVAEKPAAPAAPSPVVTAPPPASTPSAQTTALSAAAPVPSVSQDELNAVRGACTLNDITQHCSWIAPTSSEIVLCLRANAAGLSPACRAVVSGSVPPDTAAEPSAAPTAPPRQTEHESTQPHAAAAAATGKPTAAQTAAIRSACRSDFIANCSGVQPGGSAAVECLQSNSARLSPACRNAVAAIGGGVPGSTPGASGTPVAPAAPAPLKARAFIPARTRLVVLRICRSDVYALCSGTPPGGGRIIDCLAINARSLSPDCYAAVARVSH